jgi:pyruvate/2-oxoglutarate dehydrogenase complex dihydrolipoamide acyltransferase (E2) component
VGKWGVESLRPIAPWISLLHYGMIDADGNLTVRLTFDHRVLDGSGPSTALVEMERFLKTDIVGELKALGQEPRIAS